MRLVVGLVLFLVLIGAVAVVVALAAAMMAKVAGRRSAGGGVADSVPGGGMPLGTGSQGVPGSLGAGAGAGAAIGGMEGTGKLGAVVRVPDGERTCPRPGCGGTNPEGTKFCRRCGVTLSGDQ